MWNSLELQCPTDDLVAYPPPDHYILENLRDFVTVLTTSADILTPESPLWDEMNFLKNIQAKYKRILHCDRFLVFLHRVAHCLRKMVLLNLSKSYLNLAESFLVGFNHISGTPYLPSRQQVEYVLIRTLSASRLVCEAVNYSHETFCFLIQKLKVGHLILDLIMATSIVARLHILLRATLEQLSSMYKQVLFWRYKVKKGEFQWAEKFNFPQDVEEWIKSSEPSSLKPLSLSKEDITWVKSLFHQKKGMNNKMDCSDTDSVVLVDEVKLDFPERIKIADTDFGEVVARVASGKYKPSPKNSMQLQQNTAEDLYSLTEFQRSLLQKILQVKSLLQLENVWDLVNRSSHEYFPGILSTRKNDIVNESFNRIKMNYSHEIFCKEYETRPEFLKKFILKICKKLGFKNGHITRYGKTLVESPKLSDTANASVSLVPVKTVKELKLLYFQLAKSLECEPQKLVSLKKIYKHRIIDIRRLKKEGNKELAKKLTSCTSKEFLALAKIS